MYFSLRDCYQLLALTRSLITLFATSCCASAVYATVMFTILLSVCPSISHIHGLC